MTNKLYNIAVLCVCATALVACGTAKDNEPNPTPDDVAPIVKSLSPATIASKQEIGLDETAITIKLSEPIDPASLTALNAKEIRSNSGELLEGEWSFNSTTNELVFTIKNTPLTADQTYTIDLSSDVTDQAGNALVYSIRFSTAKQFGVTVAVTGLDSGEYVKVTQTSVAHSDVNSSVTLTDQAASGDLNATLSDGEAYVLSVSEMPDGKFCALSKAYDVIQDKNASVEVKCHDVLPYNASAPDWNDYFSVDPSKPSLHGGERRAIVVDGIGSCDGIAASDQLDVFQWDCEVVDDGNATQIKVFSTALKDGKGLSDLLNLGLTPGWKNNQVTVTQNGQNIKTSASGIWWNNPVLVTPDTPSLSLEGAVYVHVDKNGNDPDLEQSFTITNGGIALVIDPSLELNTLSGGVKADLTGASRQGNIWLEGKINAERDTGLYINTAYYSRLNNLTVVNADSDGIEIHKSAFIKLHNVTVRNSSKSGIVVNDSSFAGFGIDIKNTAVAGNGESGIVLNSGYNKLINVTSSTNSANGIALNQGNNVLSGINSSNNAADGIAIEGAQNNLFSLLTISNNNGYGLHYAKSGVNEARNNNLLAASLTNNKLAGIQFDDTLQQTNVESNALTNLLDAYNAASNCAHCNNVTSITTTDASPETVFVAVSSDSQVSGYDPATGMAVSKITDFVPLQNGYRSWGSKNAPSATAGSGSCLTEGEVFCSIYDTSLLNNDTLALNTLAEPSGEVTFTFAGDTQITYLDNAVEINTDGIGNDNGFCEANETCLILTNHGSYQGHGELATYEGTNDTWTALGITLLKYKSNGY